MDISIHPKTKNKAVVSLGVGIVTALLSNAQAQAGQVIDTSRAALRGIGNTNVEVTMLKNFPICDVVTVQAFNAIGHPLAVFNGRTQWTTDLRPSATTYETRTAGFTSKITTTSQMTSGDILKVLCGKAPNSETKQVVTQVLQEIALKAPGTLTIPIAQSIAETLAAIKFIPNPNFVGRFNLSCLYGSADRSGSFKCEYLFNSNRIELKQNETMTLYPLPGTYNMSLNVTPTKIPEGAEWKTWTTGTGALNVTTGSVHNVTAYGAFSPKLPDPSYTLECNHSYSGGLPGGVTDNLKCVYEIGKDKHVLSNEERKVLTFAPNSYRVRSYYEGAPEGYEITPTRTGLASNINDDSLTYTFEAGKTYTSGMSLTVKKIENTPFQCVTSTPELISGSCTFTVSNPYNPDLDPGYNPIADDGSTGTASEPMATFDVQLGQQRTIPATTGNGLDWKSQVKGIVTDAEYWIPNGTATGTVIAPNAARMNVVAVRNDTNVILKCDRPASTGLFDRIYGNMSPQLYYPQGNYTCDYTVNIGAVPASLNGHAARAKTLTGTLTMGSSITLTPRMGSTVQVKTTVTSIPNDGYVAEAPAQIDTTFTVASSALTLHSHGVFKSKTDSLPAASTIRVSATGTSTGNSDTPTCDQVVIKDSEKSALLLPNNDSAGTLLNNNLTAECFRGSFLTKTTTIPGTGDVTVEFREFSTTAKRGAEIYVIGTSSSGGQSDPIPPTDPISPVYDDKPGNTTQPMDPVPSDPISEPDPNWQAVEETEWAPINEPVAPPTDSKPGYSTQPVIQPVTIESPEPSISDGWEYVEEEPTTNPDSTAVVDPGWDDWSEEPLVGETSPIEELEGSVSDYYDYSATPKTDPITTTPYWDEY